MYNAGFTKRPSWLKIKLPGGTDFLDVKRILNQQRLNTVCKSAHCPNLSECWNRRTATFMILGDICTRNCRFCAVNSGVPNSVDNDEPKRVAQAVQQLGLKYVVITSVTRDDLEDGGAQIFANTIIEIRNIQTECKIEVLIPDFKGIERSLLKVLHARPDVLNHNIETVKKFYTRVRPQASYERSLSLLKKAATYGALTKSGLMLGLGETMSEVKQVILDLVSVNCQILTLGQYLQPTKNHLPVARFLRPDEFTELKKYGLSAGLRHVEAGPLVRSSYHADEQINSLMVNYMS